MVLNTMNSVPVTLPRREIMSRLGYNRHLNVMDDAQRGRIDQSILDGFALCRPRARWGCFDINPIGADGVFLPDGTFFPSRALAELLQGSHVLWVAAVTVGPEISVAAAEKINKGDGAAAAIYDAVGSESADATMDWLQNYQNALLTRTGEKLTRKRFSPGYSDLSLGVQRDIFRLLQLEQFGLCLTGSMIIEPEKSVTALAGIK